MRLLEIQHSLKQEIENFPYPASKYKYRSSTLDFQNKSGIHVTQNYKMPDGLPVEVVYRYLSSVLRALDTRKIKKAEYDARVNRLADEVIRLNPELKSIQAPNVFQPEVHILTAALSLFPVEDIKSYVEDGKTARWYISQPDKDLRFKMISEIENLTGANIYWVMSDSTLQKVYSKVMKKYKK